MTSNNDVCYLCSPHNKATGIGVDNDNTAVDMRYVSRPLTLRQQTDRRPDRNRLAPRRLNIAIKARFAIAASAEQWLRTMASDHRPPSPSYSRKRQQQRCLHGCTGEATSFDGFTVSLHGSLTRLSG